MVILSLLVIAFAAVCYFKVIKPLKYWQEKGVVCKTPVPLFGNLAPLICQMKSMQDVITDVYKRFPNHRYVGFYEFGQPILIIRDLELIKQITIKDFEAFPDHKQLVPLNIDTLWEKNVFQMSVKQGWHSLRSTLSPTFTSSKMKTMFVLMQDCSKQFVEYFKRQNTTVSIDVNDAVTKFASDVIGTTAFGITCDSLNHPENEFFMMGKEVANVSLLKLLGFSVIPRLMKFLGFKFFSNRVNTFFRKIIKDTLDYRKKKNVFRPDMIHLMLEAQKTGLEFTDEIITAQALGFFSAGFDSISTILTFIMYDISINPDVQQKLFEEITEVTDRKEVTYQSLLAMEYLDCVVSESLRLHLHISVFDRVCVKPYTIEPVLPTEKLIHLDAGTIIYLPVTSIHLDEKYFPDPTKYDPERFNTDNKDKILPFSYFPFGVGPRNCIGSRFALMEIKLLIVELLQKFEIVPNEKTQIPLKLSKINGNTIPKEGIWLSLRPRLN